MAVKNLAEIWLFSQKGRADEGDDTARSLVSDKISGKLDYELTSGRRVRIPGKMLHAKQLNSFPLEDVPWNNATPMIISGRLKSLLSKAAPGQAQYIPIMIKLRDRSTKKYWVVNCLKMVQCTHPKLSKWTLLTAGGGSWRSYNTFAIDLRRVPRNALIFRDIDYPVAVFIRRRLRMAIEAAGITGAQFYSVVQGR